MNERGCSFLHSFSAHSPAWASGIYQGVKLVSQPQVVACNVASRPAMLSMGPERPGGWSHVCRCSLPDIPLFLQLDSVFLSLAGVVNLLLLALMVSLGVACPIFFALDTVSSFYIPLPDKGVGLLQAKLPLQPPQILLLATDKTLR